MLTKNKKACALVSRTLATRAITKHYRALVATEEQTIDGTTPLRVNQHLIHHMLPSSRSPKIFSSHPYAPPSPTGEDPRTLSFECHSRIVALTPATSRSVREWRAAAIGDELLSAVDAWAGGAGPDRSLTLQEVTLELMTGRTHQARGQLATLGSGCHSSYHIAGDNIYLGATSLPPELVDGYRSSPYLALQASSLSLPFKGKAIELRASPPFWSALLPSQT